MSDNQYLKYSIIIPAYNEEKRISHLLSSLSDTNAEFIFVCDGNDGTNELLSAYAEAHPDLTIRVLSYARRLGKGGGVREGFRAATCPIVAFMDADNSTEYSEIRRLVGLLGNNDGVIGSRHLSDSSIRVHQPWRRRLQSRGFNLLIRLLFGLFYTDTQCGAKVFAKQSIDQILPLLRTCGFEFDVEILWRLQKAGRHIIEVPVVWNDTQDSRLRTSDTFSMFKSLVLLRFL
jgi:dolichol-phosphate mannosyltransferase